MISKTKDVRKRSIHIFVTEPHVSFILHPITKCVDRTHYGNVVPFIICFVSEIPKCISIKSSTDILYLRLLDESRFSSCFVP